MDANDNTANLDLHLGGKPANTSNITDITDTSNTTNTTDAVNSADVSADVTNTPAAPAAPVAAALPTPTAATLPAPAPTTADKVEEEDYNELLQAELERYKRDMDALQSEFNTVDEDGSPNATKKALIAAAPGAIREITLLSNHAESESVRLSASKYIVDVALGKSKLETDADGFNSLIEKLQQNKEQDAKDMKKNRM